MWYKKNFFKIATGIILVLLIILLTINILPVISTILNLATSILLPVIIAVVLYYVLRPLLRFLEQKRIPRILSLIFIYCLLFIFFGFVITFIWPTIGGQIAEFTSTPHEKLQEVEQKTVDIMDLFNFASLTQEQLREILRSNLQKIFSLIYANLFLTLSSAAKITSYFIITPFILFYLLKDDHSMYQGAVKVVPRNYKKQTVKILSDTDQTLSSFISSQIMVAAIVGVLIFFGYWAIGLNYAFLLALFAFVFNLIPFCGPIISTIPALFIALSDSALMGFKVICVVCIVHLLDLNLISPRVVGPRLKLHPITIILLLVVGVSLAGFLGLFVIVPLYAVLKVVFNDVYTWNQSAEEDT